MSSGLQSQNRKTLGTVSSSQCTSKPKSAAVKDIDIGINIVDILERESSVNIDIGKGNIDPPLVSHTSYTRFKHMRQM